MVGWMEQHFLILIVVFRKSLYMHHLNKRLNALWEQTCVYLWREDLEEAESARRPV